MAAGDVQSTDVGGHVLGHSPWLPDLASRSRCLICDTDWPCAFVPKVTAPDSVLSEREIAANYMDRIKRAIEVLEDAYGHADAPYEPAALNALHILRGLDRPFPAASGPEGGRMSATVDSYEEVGIDYCLVHHGTRNEDESGDRCEWAEFDEESGDDGEPRPCQLVPLLNYTKPAASGDGGDA